MSEGERVPFSVDPNAERARERKRMDRIVTLRALLLETAAVAFILYVVWLVFVSSHRAS